ncbi:hypothetical protein [Burkholderia thailandensis]|uniref:hypothetical protein n=1 Tax=Burkholderia thailandensis TaxID=57975 RepID=UPI000AF72789|nr:hypothetical protein [Burkholderia thailandensis]MCS6478076.1 hypothetical protein [Burkholderia thailandensis]QRA14169.1 hypothetical protein JMY07_19115 [Burkholderia thailandensis]
MGPTLDIPAPPTSPENPISKIRSESSDFRYFRIAMNGVGLPVNQESIGGPEILCGFFVI